MNLSEKRRSFSAFNGGPFGEEGSNERSSEERPGSVFPLSNISSGFETILASGTFVSKILTVTISRFFREREVFETLRQSVIPALLSEGREEIRVWSIGCANGEEPYSFSLLWKEGFEKAWSHIRLSILATDINGDLLERARAARYKKGSLKEMPEEILRSFFKVDRDSYVLDEAAKNSVEFREHDILREEPFPDMDIVFCRNLAFTYFSTDSQIAVVEKIARSIRNEGYLVIGKDERVPLTYPTLFIPAFPAEKINRRFIHRIPEK